MGRLPTRAFLKPRHSTDPNTNRTLPAKPQQVEYRCHRHRFYPLATSFATTVPFPVAMEAKTEIGTSLQKKKTPQKDGLLQTPPPTPPATPCTSPTPPRTPPRQIVKLSWNKHPDEIDPTLLLAPRAPLAGPRRVIARPRARVLLPRILWPSTVRTVTDWDMLMPPTKSSRAAVTETRSSAANCECSRCGSNHSMCELNCSMCVCKNGKDKKHQDESALENGNKGRTMVPDKDKTPRGATGQANQSES